MQRPDKLLFVDEVGSNTSTTKDGHVGGEKFCAKQMGVHRSRPQRKTHILQSWDLLRGQVNLSCVPLYLLQQQCASHGSWVSMQKRFGFERIMTFEVTPAAFLSDIHKGQFAKSTVRQSQHSAAALRTAALLPRYLLICFVSLMVSTSLTDLMLSRPFSFSTVTAVALNCLS